MDDDESYNYLSQNIFIVFLFVCFVRIIMLARLTLNIVDIIVPRLINTNCSDLCMNRPAKYSRRNSTGSNCSTTFLMGLHSSFTIRPDEMSRSPFLKCTWNHFDASMHQVWLYFFYIVALVGNQPVASQNCSIQNSKIDDFCLRYMIRSRASKTSTRAR
jgi:hypothetical protein